MEIETFCSRNSLDLLHCDPYKDIFSPPASVDLELRWQGGIQ